MAKRATRILSDVQLRAWVASGRPVAKSDGDGLTFTLSGGGTASWVLRYRHGARRKEINLGRYPDMSLSLARSMASEQRLRIGAGTDVAVEKKRERAKARAAWTIQQLVRSYRTKVLPTLAPVTAKCRAGQINEILSRFGSYIVANVTADDAHDWLEAVAESRSYHAASNLRKAAVSVFKHAVAQRLIKSDANPFINVAMEAVAAKPETRQRIKLEPREIGAFLRGLCAVDETDAMTWRLMLLTGVRAGEMIGAEWTEVDFDRAMWRIPRERIKTRARMVDSLFAIPLPPVAVDWFRCLHALAGGSRWVLPARVYRQADKHADHERILMRLKAYTAKLDGCRDIVLHDLRSTMRSHLTGTLNVRVEVAEKCLNHKLGGLLGVYDKGDYMPQRVDALSRWADYMDMLQIGGNVAPLHRVASKNLA